MTEKLFKYMGFIGLITPAISIFLVFWLPFNALFDAIYGDGIGGSFFTFYLFSYCVGIWVISLIYTFLWLWYPIYPRSENKRGNILDYLLFTKRRRGDFNKAFGIHSITLSSYIVIASLISTFSSFAIILIGSIVSLVLGNIIRIRLTSKIFLIDTKKSINCIIIATIVDLVLFAFYWYALSKILRNVI